MNASSRFAQPLRVTARRATGPFARLRLVWRDAAALLLALRDPRVGAQSKIIALAALLYAVSPIDLLPDGVPLLGLTDDLLLVPAVLAFAARNLPAPVLQDARGKLARLTRPSARLNGGLQWGKVWLLAALLLGLGLYLLRHLHG